MSQPPKKEESKSIQPRKSVEQKVHSSELPRKGEKKSSQSLHQMWAILMLSFGVFAVEKRCSEAE
jgi:hypothetical protein